MITKPAKPQISVVNEKPASVLSEKVFGTGRQVERDKFEHLKIRRQVVSLRQIPEEPLVAFEIMTEDQASR